MGGEGGCGFVRGGVTACDAVRLHGATGVSIRSDGTSIAIAIAGAVQQRSASTKHIRNAMNGKGPGTAHLPRK